MLPPSSPPSLSPSVSLFHAFYSFFFLPPSPFFILLLLIFSSPPPFFFLSPILPPPPSSSSFSSSPSYSPSPHIFFSLRPSFLSPSLYLPMSFVSSFCFPLALPPPLSLFSSDDVASSLPRSLSPSAVLATLSF